MNKLRTIFTAAMICLVVSIIAVSALTSWNKTFTWTTPPTTSGFEVYDENKITIWNQTDEYLGVLGTTIYKNFWAANTQNVALTVNVIAITYINCTYSWTSLSQLIAAYEGAWFNLTVIPDTTKTAGLFSFQFSKT